MNHIELGDLEKSLENGLTAVRDKKASDRWSQSNLVEMKLLSSVERLFQSANEVNLVFYLFVADRGRPEA